MRHVGPVHNEGKYLPVSCTLLSHCSRDVVPPYVLLLFHHGAEHPKGSAQGPQDLIVLLGLLQ